MILLLRKYILYLIIGAGYIALTYWLGEQIRLSNAYLAFLIRAMISVCVPGLITCVIFYKTPEFTAVKGLTVRLVRGMEQKFRARKEKKS